MLATEFLNQFGERQPNRFGKPTLKVQDTRDFFEELLAREVLPLARAQKAHAQPGYQRSEADREPMPDALPPERVRQSHPEYDAGRRHHHQRQRRALISPVR